MKETQGQTEGTGEVGHLTRLFHAQLEFKSYPPADAVVPTDDPDGEYIGSGDGTVTGDRLCGGMTWTLSAKNCLYPLIRRGELIPDAPHLCKLTFGGFIETSDAARITFAARGYGLRSPEQYLLSATLTFSAPAAKYTWLTRVLAVMNGTLHEGVGRATWDVYVPVADQTLG